MDNGTHDSDDALVIEALQGDERSASRLYERYSDRVLRIGYRIVLNENLAKDVSQETWIKIFRHLSRYRPGSSFGAWISSIAVRTAIDVLRKQRSTLKTDPIDDLYPLPAGCDPPASQQLAEKEVEAEVKRVLSGLLDNQRAAFILRHFEGASLREIGTVLDCSEGTVKAHVYRAASVLRRHMAKWLKTSVEK